MLASAPAAAELLTLEARATREAAAVLQPLNYSAYNIRNVAAMLITGVNPRIDRRIPATARFQRFAVASSSETGVSHSVTYDNETARATGCSCTAGVNGHQCRHQGLVIVRLAQAARRMTEQMGSESMAALEAAYA